MPKLGLRWDWSTYFQTQNQTFAVKEKYGSGHKEKLQGLSSNSDFAMAILSGV